jgi:hypothetical protein
MFKMKVLADLVSPEASLLCPPLCPHKAFSLCACTPSITFSSYKDTSPIGLGFPPPRPHLTLITSLKDLSPNIITLGK